MRLASPKRLLFVGRVLAIALLYFAAGHAADYQSGRTYFGTNKYIEYQAGDLPLVISAPHGGRETPAEIPERTDGVLQMDSNTQELARAIAAAVLAQTGHRPHLVICRLHRKKLDCNREAGEAAAGDPIAEKAWTEYHGFIDAALEAAVAKQGKAFLIDLHGHAHPDARVELGYQHSQRTLSESDEKLNELAAQGTFRLVAQHSKLPYAALLRGPKSLGALLETHNFRSTPSPSQPVPNVPYFQGGYTMRRHAMSSGPVAGLQIETNFRGLRDTAENRARFAGALVATLQEFLADQLAVALGAGTGAALQSK